MDLNLENIVILQTYKGEDRLHDKFQNKEAVSAKISRCLKKAFNLRILRGGMLVKQFSASPVNNILTLLLYGALLTKERDITLRRYNCLHTDTHL